MKNAQSGATDMSASTSSTTSLADSTATASPSPADLNAAVAAAAAAAASAADAAASANAAAEAANNLVATLATVARTYQPGAHPGAQTQPQPLPKPEVPATNPFRSFNNLSQVDTPPPTSFFGSRQLPVGSASRPSHTFKSKDHGTTVAVLRTALIGAPPCGVLKSDPGHSFALYYIPDNLESDRHNILRRVNFPIEEDGIARQLFRKGRPSKHTVLGTGVLSSVLDPQQRAANEITPPSILLTTDPSQRVLRSLGKILNREDLTATFLRLNMYDSNGHFAEHVDRTRGDGHVGTLVVGLLSRFTGGELVVQGTNSDIVLDWSGSDDLPWAYIPLGTPHMVKPVTAGIRFTLQYAVYASWGVQQPPLYTSVNKLTSSTRDVLPAGGVLLFTLSREYTPAEIYELQHKRNILPLHPADRALVAVLPDAVAWELHPLQKVQEELKTNDRALWVVPPLDGSHDKPQQTVLAVILEPVEDTKKLAPAAKEPTLSAFTFSGAPPPSTSAFDLKFENGSLRLPASGDGALFPALFSNFPQSGGRFD